MEIIKEFTANYKEFENIEYGTVFEYDEYFYIKMYFEARIENAVCLNSGKTTHFGPTDRVKIINASLMVKD